MTAWTGTITGADAGTDRQARPLSGQRTEHGPMKAWTGTITGADAGTDRQARPALRTEHERSTDR